MMRVVYRKDKKYEHLVLMLWWRAYVFEDMGGR